MSSDSPPPVDPLAHRDPPRQIAHTQHRLQQQATTQSQRAQQHSGGATVQATATSPSLIRPIVGEPPQLDSMPPPPPRMRAPQTGSSSAAAAAEPASATGRAQHSDASASSSIPQMQGQDRSGPAWLAQNAAALGQPRSKGQQPQQPQTTQAAASASGQPLTPISRSKHSAGAGASLVSAALSPSPPSAPPLAQSAAAAAARAPRPIPTLKTDDTRRTLQHTNEEAAGEREAAAHAPASASAQIKGTAAAGAAASGEAAATRKAPTAKTSAPSSAPSSSATAAPSSASTARAASSSDHNGGLSPLRPIAPPPRKPHQSAPSSSSAESAGPSEAASSESPQSSSSSAPSVASVRAVWFDVMCNGCRQCPLIGARFRCTVCADVDLCADCQADGFHTHLMQRWATPADKQLQAQQSKAAVLRVNGAAAAGNAAESTASQPLSSSAGAAASHSSSTPNADAEEQGHAKSAAPSRHRRDATSAEELSEGQEPNSSDESQDDDDDDDDDSDAEMGDAAAEDIGEAASTHKRISARNAAKQHADPALSDGSDDGALSSSRRRNGHSLERAEIRSLPDFYIDPRTGERMVRPTRKTSETTREFKARYWRWYKRGKAVWTPAGKQQREKQKGSQALAASSSSAAASGAQDRPRRSTRRASAVGGATGDDRAGGDSSSSSAAADNSDDSDGSSDGSSSDSESIPPRPTLIDCGDNLAKYEVRLLEWKAAYGQRSDAEEEPLSRAQRRPRAYSKEDSAESSDEDTTLDSASAQPHAASSPRPRRSTASTKRAWVRKPDFYIDAIGRRIHRPAHTPGETKEEYARRYNRWWKAGNAAWTQEELDAAAAQGASAHKNESSSDEDEDSDYDESQAASAPASAARSRKPVRRHHRAKDELKADCTGDDDDAEFDEGPALGPAPPSADTLARSLRRRRLPDSYVDPKTRLVMTRPVRGVGESDAEFNVRYNRWRDRGRTISAAGFAKAAGNNDRKPAASRAAAASSGVAAAAAAPSAAAPLTTPQLPLSNGPPEMMTLFDQFMRFASHNAGQAAAAQAQPVTQPFARQLQAPAHATAAAAESVAPLLSSSSAESAMRDDDETDHAGAPSMPALDGSHSSAAQSRHLHRVPQSASSVSGAASSLAATHAHSAAAGSGKRKSESRDRLVYADGAAAGAATAGTAAPIPGSSASASKRARPSAIPTLETPQMAFASDAAPHAHHSPQSAASSSSSADGHSSIADRLSATSTLSLILAACISDPAKHGSCLSALLDGDITLADLERDFAIHFPRVGVPPMVQWGLITAGPAAKMQAIIRQRIELKQQMDNDCIELKREARAAGK